MPWFCSGHPPWGAWNCQYATAIMPERMNATGRVKRPSKDQDAAEELQHPADPCLRHQGRGARSAGHAAIPAEQDHGAGLDEQKARHHAQQEVRGLDRPFHVHWRPPRSSARRSSISIQLG